MKKVLCLDPGITTGWGLIDTHPTKLLASGQFNFPTLYGGDHKEKAVAVFLQALKQANAVVIEDFVGAGGYRSKPITLTLSAVGYLRALAHAKNLEAKLQVPQTRRPYLTQAERMTGFTRHCADRHATDAVAHGLADIERHLSNKHA